MARCKAHCRLPVSDMPSLIELYSSHGWGTIKRNLSKSAFSERVGHFERKFLGRWWDEDVDVARYPSIYGPLDRQMTKLQLCLWKFSHKETLQQTYFDRSWILLTKQQNRVLCHPLGDLGVTYTHRSSIVRWKARGRLPNVRQSYTKTCTSEQRVAANERELPPWRMMHYPKIRLVCWRDVLKGVEAGSS